MRMAQVVWSKTWVTWVNQLGQGSQEAWRRFMSHRRPGILEIAAGMGLSPADADAIANDVEFALFQQMQKGKFVYEEAGSFNGYLRRMVKTKVIDTWRARKPTAALSEVPELEERVQQTWDAEDDRRRQAFEQAMQHLAQTPDGQRDLQIFLQSLEKRPVKDTAAEF